MGLAHTTGDCGHRGIHYRAEAETDGHGKDSLMSNVKGDSSETERALREALEEQRRVEQELRATLVEERAARERAETSDAFKEVFLAMLGHDLRNPLNTILTTARLMVMRGELPPESQKRLERVVVSGVRIERMID